jgi:predicted unusual protein kinase regulating ubiquinone biosynthesis (AarF/ABC1/UbiB family)
VPSGHHGQATPPTENPLTRARYRRITRFAARYLAQTWWYELVLPRFGLVAIAKKTRARRMRRFAQKFHVLAVDLGGLMIKVGQFMSSRLDVLPPEITTELEGLQDEVPPVPFDIIRTFAEQQLGMPLGVAFAFVDEVPLAAASLGQTHRATLITEDADLTGFESVVLKVQRPGIDDIVAVDLAALRRVGGWLSRVKLVSNRVNMPALVEEFAATSLEEIDYLNEAANVERFTEQFAGDDRVSVPKVVWERTTRQLLTLEDVSAIKITDDEALRAAGINPSLVAPVFADVMFDQLFEAGFFHADPHPGNIFITPDPENPGPHPWRLTFIDFGMMGEVPRATRSNMRALIIAIASRDARAVLAASKNLDVLLPSADTVQLERALSQLFSRFGGMGFAELRQVDPREFFDFAIQFRDLVQSLPFQLPKNFLMIIRAVSLTSGVCSTLNPAYNLWDSVEPYADRLIREERGNVVRDIGKDAVRLVELAWRLPKRIDTLLTTIEEGNLEISNPRLEQRADRIDRSARRMVSAVLFGGLLVAGALVRPDDPTFGTVLIVASVVPLLHAVFSGFGNR